MPRAHLRFARVGSLSVQAFSGDPTDEEWGRLLEDLASTPSGRKYSPVLVSTDGGGPNAAQRRRLGTVLQAHPQRAAILTKSKVPYGIITAIGWLDPSIETRAFKPENFASAAAYLELPEADHGSIKRVLDGLRADLGLPPLFANEPPSPKGATPKAP